MNYARYYNLERYLFSEVHQRFNKEGYLNTFDFFCIVIWKANRAKSKIASKLLRNFGSLEKAARDITAQIYNAPSDKERLQLLLWGGFRLPMASAILSVLYPERFTVYDIRVCEQLDAYHRLADRKDPTDEYFKFVEDVRRLGPSLREADKEIWGKSFAEQLTNDINNTFGVDK